jgi:hypothetical protein
MGAYRDRLLGIGFTTGRTRVRERVTVNEDGTRVRELRDPETNASVYHHSSDDSRQDVTHRPAAVRITREDLGL